MVDRDHGLASLLGLPGGRYEAADPHRRAVDLDDRHHAVRLPPVRSLGPGPRLVNQGLEHGDRVAIARAVEDKVKSAFPQLADVARQPQVKPSGHDPAVKLAADREAVAPSGEMHAVADAALEHGSIWPVFLAGAAFLYIWWLAILLFDLTFVWHLYIRWPGAENYVRKRRVQKERAGAAPAP